MPRQRWVPNSGKQTAAPLPRKGTGRERSFYIEKTHSARRFPSRTSRACSLPKQKTQRLCVSSRWVPILSTHNLKRLASARHSRTTLTRFSCTLQTNQSVKTKKADDVFSRRHLYCGTPVVTSWAVAGQQVVFFHMYLQTESR